MHCTVRKWSWLVAFLTTISSPALAEWEFGREPTFGDSFSYPTQIFHPLDNQNKPHFRYFTSNSLEAKFVMGAWEKTKGQTTAE